MMAIGDYHSKIKPPLKFDHASVTKGQITFIEIKNW